MATRSPRKSAPTTRYAFPFFSPLPPGRRPAHSLGNSGAAFAHNSVGPIPKPRGDARLALSDLLGAAAVTAIQSAGHIRFHSTGDTGRTTGSQQQDVADAMTEVFDPHSPASNPAFFFHLGDVIYGTQKDLLYRDEFYRPYLRYPAKILAVPGNHDGETFAGTDPKPLAAFLANFCAATPSIPPAASGAGIFRETMTLPGVYWMLDAPFVQIIGLYSNIAEGPGDLEGKGGDTQQSDWLKKTLTAIATARAAGTRKALVIGVHHPPFSQGGHSGSPLMLQQLDAACNAAKIGPDLLLAGHSHTYQRYTRKVTIAGKVRQVPYIVAGCGGHNDQAVKDATGQVDGDHTFEKSARGFGYLDIAVDAHRIKVDFHLVLGAGAPAVFDSVTVPLP